MIQNPRRPGCVPLPQAMEWLAIQEVLVGAQVGKWIGQWQWMSDPKQQNAGGISPIEQPLWQSLASLVCHPEGEELFEPCPIM